MFGIPTIYMWLIGGVSALALLGGVYATGDLHGHQSCTTNMARVAQAQTVQMVHDIQIQQVQNLTRETQLQTQIKTITTQRDSLKEQLSAVQTPNVNLSLGDVRLLNNGRLPPGATSSSQPGPTATDATPSTTTLASFIDLALDDYAQYNIEANRCDQLRQQIKDYIAGK